MRYTLATLLLPTLACLPLVAEEPMLGGASLGYTQLFAGQFKVDGQTGDWDNGQRGELMLRDYYFAQQSYHPFFELSLLVENHEGSADDLEIDAETIALGFTVGAAVPCWRQPDDSLVFGYSPYLGLNLGRLDLDVRYTNPSNPTHSDDNAFRWGLATGIDAWLLIQRNITISLGVLGSYWRGNGIYVETPISGGGSDLHPIKPSGWDLGARVTVGVAF